MAVAEQPAVLDPLQQTSLQVPAPDAVPWPTLGFDVADWIEDHLVHGPGDKLGDPVVLTDEARLFLLRAYEVYPPGHAAAGRRRFKRCAVSRRKGWAKTELAAFVAIAEMDPGAPVRCGGWDAAGAPVGVAVRDPYIPMVATTEEQVEDLAYGAVCEILRRCPLGNEYDVGLARIMHGTAPGKMVALASSPSARDGARTTFQHFDETHLFVSDRLLRAHSTMLRNIPKRMQADAWSLETTTMYEPAAGSVAELTHMYAIQVHAGHMDDPRLLFDHRQAAERWNLDDPDELRAAIVEASGDAIGWTDIDSVMALWADPQQARPEFCRFFLNQRVKAAPKMFSPDLWARRADLARPVPPPGTRVVLAFDGSYSRDSTALLGCTVEERPHLFVLGLWEKPLSDPGWRVPVTAVQEAVHTAMDTYEVAEFAYDPPGWRAETEEWELAWDVCEPFQTNRPALMGPATDEFTQAMAEGDFTHDGNADLARHVGNCITRTTYGHRVPVKSHPDSPDKIDLAIGAIIGYSRARWQHLNAVPAGDPPFAWA